MDHEGCEGCFDCDRDKSNEFSKLMKFFCTRIVQSIVQSRMGDFTNHPCKIKHENSDWFNIIVDEIGEIAAYLKSSITKYPPQCTALSVEIILHTSDGESLPLESWIISVDLNNVDKKIDIQKNCYQQMSIMLKSIIMAARYTPCYRYYVRKQSADTFVLFYRVIEEKSDLSILDDGKKSKRIGYFPSPFGTINVDLHYRTKMEIEPTPFVELQNNLKETQQFNEKISESNSAFHQASIAVPVKGSEIVTVSPMSDDLNTFSMSMTPQEFQLNSQFKLGQSLSSTEESASKLRNTSGNSNRISDPSSLETSNSFPLRSSGIKSREQLQFRNNSFPFASLLLDSKVQSPFDQCRSQTLMKVYENKPLTLHSSNSEHLLNAKIMSMKNRRPRTISLDTEFKYTQKIESPSSNEPSLEGPLKHGSSSSLLSYKDTSNRKVIFTCTLEEESSKEELDKEDPETCKNIPLSTSDNHNGGIMEDDDDFSSSSDDSYVKIFATSSTTQVQDLSGFFQDVKSAPLQLSSFYMEDTENLKKQIIEFEDKMPMFDDFLATLNDKEE